MTNKESFCRIILYACIYFFGAVLLIWLPIGLNILAENLISGENDFSPKSKTSVLIDGLLIYPLLYFFTIYTSLQYEKIRQHLISLLLWFFPAIFVCIIIGFCFYQSKIGKNKILKYFYPESYNSAKKLAIASQDSGDMVLFQDTDPG